MGLTLQAQLAIAFLLFVCGFSVWFGRLPEKLGGVAAALNEGVYLLVYHPGDNVHAQWEAMIIDAIYALGLAFIAFKWDRGWAKWAAALELLIVGTHLAVAADLRIATFFEYWGAALLTIAVLWTLLIGTIVDMVRQRRERLTARVDR